MQRLQVCSNTLLEEIYIKIVTKDIEMTTFASKEEVEVIGKYIAGRRPMKHRGLLSPI